MTKLDDQLKAAIVSMPVKEKDKLLLRLAAKDKKLIRRLEFELIEGGSTRDARAAELKSNIAKDLLALEKSGGTPGYLLLYLRHWNARITEHVQATKDKEGEVILTLFMLAEAFRIHQGMLESFPDRRSEKLAPYIVRRTKTILVRAEKLHEDYFIEFKRDLQELLQYIWAFRPTEQAATAQKLPKSWN